MALGANTKSIATKLGLSAKTIEWHINGTKNPSSLAAKLGTSDRSQLIRIAVERNLVSIGERLESKPAKMPPPESMFKNVEDLKAAVLLAATQAANNNSDPTQVSALCSTVDAYVKLLRVQLDSWSHSL